MKTFLALLGSIGFPGVMLAVTPLTESSFTQVINDVKVMAMPAKAVKMAKLAEPFKAPDLLQTGADSLAELTAVDKTVTRIGANTVFSFDPKGRSIRLEKGSVLFHSPTGKGGGTIRTGGASASVLGTTIVVVTTVEGGFKAIVLEGKGEVRLPNGDFRILRAGQLVFILPGSKTFGPLLNVNLDKLVHGARLVNGFEAKLPSLDRIEVEVASQNRLIESGRAEDTRLLVGNSATKDDVKVVDDNLIERAVTDTPLQIAMRTDAIINRSLLDPKHLFLDPFQLQISGVDQTTFRGFVAKDVTITTPFINLDGLSSGAFPEFDLLAAGKMVIQNSVNFSGTASYPNEFKIAAIGGIDIAPFSTLTANNLGDFSIDSVANLNFVNVHFLNSYGGVHFGSTGDLALTGGSVTGSFIVPKTRNFDVLGTAFTLVSGPTSDYVDFFADNNITVNGASITGLGSSRLYMEAPNIVDLRNTTLSGIGFINLEARTVILQNIDFPGGSSVTLRSQNGLLAPNPNTSQSVQNGYVNYLSNVRYNGTLLTSTPHPSITITTTP